MAINGLRYESGEYATQSDLTTAGGLVLVASQSFSAVSSVSVNNCFSTTYENYLLLITGSNSATTNLHFRMRAAGVDASTNAYSYGAAYISNSAEAFEVGATGQNLGHIARWVTGANVSTVAQFFKPYVAAETNLVSSTVSAFARFDHFAYHGVATAYDGFSLIPASGTITGSLRVYGYRNS